MLEPVVGKVSATFCVTLFWSAVLYAYKYPLFIYPYVVGCPFSVILGVVMLVALIELIIALLIFAVTV